MTDTDEDALQSDQRKLDVYSDLMKEIHFSPPNELINSFGSRFQLVGFWTC